MHKNKTKGYWDNISDDYYKITSSEPTIKRIMEDPSSAFQKKTLNIIKNCFPNLEGKRICVPSSGDNTAVFAFHLMGAHVTSCDISTEQIKNAKCMADKYGWDIEFICQDSMELCDIGDEQYDLVYTSNGVHVWIPDLKKMYSNFNRILKKNGYYIMFETHPFIRPFDDSNEDIKVRKPYEDIGPFYDVPEYAWRIQDFINSLISAQFSIREMAEFHPEPGDLPNHCWWYRTAEEAIKDGNRKFDWKQNPWAALPQWLSVCSQK